MVFKFHFLLVLPLYGWVLSDICYFCVCTLQIIFDNILNRKIPWPAVPEEMSPQAQDLIDR